MSYEMHVEEVARGTGTPRSDLERVRDILAHGGHSLHCSRCRKTETFSKEIFDRIVEKHCWPDCCGQALALICPPAGKGENNAHPG